MSDSFRAFWPFAERPIHRAVVKCGSTVLSAGVGRLDLRLINRLALEMACARQNQIEIIYVSSGAVACGVGLTGRDRPPQTLPEKQALAAIGQCRLMHVYSSIFDAYDIRIAQILLTRADMEDRRRYLNAEYTLHTLLEEGALPIINENDTVTVDELKFGDNDGLAALIAAKMQADLLVILTDVEGLMSADPRQDPTASLVPLVEVGGPDSGAYTLAKTRGRSKFGSGGMSSKLEAARVATLAGVATVIANGTRPGALTDIFAGREVGTLFVPSPSAARERLSARERWILAKSPMGRRLLVDDGARHALLEGKKSLLPVGVIAVEGEFRKGDVVEVCDRRGAPLARGLVNYSSDLCQRMKGRKTAEIEKEFGALDYPEVIHRDNLVVPPA